MNKLPTIIIIESSRVVFEGLNQIILNSGIKCQIRQVVSISEAQSLLVSRSSFVVIINPSFIQNNIKEFTSIYMYLDKQILELFNGIINITDNPSSISYTIKNAISSENPANASVSENILSDREVDVLRLIAEGLSNKEIACKLNISINTVITHRKNISQKTGIKSASGLTIYAVLNKYISLDSSN
jgi:DNA-binding CsgD family transcriptional regulator